MWKKALVTLLFFVAMVMPVSAATEDTAQIVVTGQVVPQVNDIQLDFASPQTGVTLSQNQDVEFTITYGNDSEAATTLTLEATWDLGQVEGSSNPSVNAFEYVSGSAESAYGGAAPTINLTTRTITWQISALPAHTLDQTVSFTLRTTANYTGDRVMNIPVNARVTDPVVLPDQEVSFTYRYSAPPPSSEDDSDDDDDEPAASKTEASSSPSPTPSSVARTTGALPEVISLRLLTLSSTQADFSLNMTLPTTVRIRYGDSSRALNESITLQPSEQYRFSLPNLLPGTAYYFQLFDVTNNLPLSNNEIYVITTPERAAEHEVVWDDFTLSQHKFVAFSAAPQQVEKLQATTVAYSTSPLEFQISLPLGKTLKRVEVIVRLIGGQDEGETISLVSLGEEAWLAEILMPKASGQYEIVLRTEDVYGNIIENKLKEVSVIQPLRILNENSGEPIEGAEATFYHYNSESRLFEPLREKVISKEDGSFDVYLPPGTYKVEINHPSVASRMIEFTIDPEAPQDLPQVKVTPLPIISPQRTTNIVRQGIAATVEVPLAIAVPITVLNGVLIFRLAARVIQSRARPF